MKKLEIWKLSNKSKDFVISKIADKVDEIVCSINEQKLPNKESRGERIIFGTACACLPYKKCSFHSEPKEKSLRDAEIERLERIKFNFKCKKYNEPTNIKQGDYFTTRFYNNAIDTCIEIVDVEIMKLKTLQGSNYMDIIITMTDKNGKPIIIDSHSDLKKMRKIHNRLNKLFEKFSLSSVKDIKISYERGTYKNLQFSLTEPFDRILFEDITKE